MLMGQADSNRIEEKKQISSFVKMRAGMRMAECRGKKRYAIFLVKYNPRIFCPSTLA